MRKTHNAGRDAALVVTNIPADHPRAVSLRTRERMKEAYEQGLVHATGLIAHGRGEAFDYLLGERSPESARLAAQIAARAIVAARHPVLCVNGNVVALAAKQVASLARASGARVEVNLFHRTPERVRRLADAMRDAGVEDVLGEDPDARIEGLSSDRALCSSVGVAAADLVLVPLEDGDRCEALVAAGKTVVTIELNPLTRTANAAHVTIVDELTRALPVIEEEVRRVREGPGAMVELASVLEGWDNRANLREARLEMMKRLQDRPS
jgi:4-phosphopantoate---beta-alanine ligase